MERVVLANKITDPDTLEYRDIQVGDTVLLSNREFYIIGIGQTVDYLTGIAGTKEYLGRFI